MRSGPAVAVAGPVKVEVIRPLRQVELIATGPSLRITKHLKRRYGDGRWRKMKGFTTIRLKNGVIRDVELDWYEAHGIGKRQIKVKRYLN